MMVNGKHIYDDDVSLQFEFTAYQMATLNVKENTSCVAANDVQPTAKAAG